MVWSEVNCEQKIPDMKNIEKSLNQLVINEQIIDNPIILEYINLCIKLSNTGDIVFKCFNVHSDPNIDYFAGRNSFNEINFFKHFFNHSNVLKSMPNKISKNIIDKDTFVNFLIDQYCIDGYLAYVALDHPYGEYSGKIRDIKELTNKVCYAMFQYRYEDILVYHKNPNVKRITDEPPYEDSSWSSWFYDIFWDDTYILIDKKTMNIWVILSTDKD